MTPRPQAPREATETEGVGNGAKRNGHEADRGLTESTGVAVLVGFTVVVTASIGVGVIFFEAGSEGVEAEFSFEYFGDSSRLTITMDQGEDIAAGNLLVSGPDGNVTWAALAGYEADRVLDVGAAVQVGPSGEYGSSVLQQDPIRVVYRPDPASETVVGEWNGG
jgi:hypothetical protein